MKTTRTLFISLIALTAMSCSLLDEDPKSYLTEEEVYGSAEMVKNNALLSIYQYIGGNRQSEGLQGTTRGIYDLNSITTDEQYIPVRGGDWYDGGYWLMLATHSWTATDESLLDTWNYIFRVITLCTRNIHNIEVAQLRFPDYETTFENYIAELRALRAMYYFYALDLYGDIPLVTYNGISHDTISQQSRSTIYRYTLNELTSVLDRLPEEYSQKEGSEYYGRVTRYVAEFVIAKLALNATVYADEDWTDNIYPEPDTILVKCGDQTLPAMQAVVYYADRLAGSFSLEDDYRSNFKVINEHSTENIFTIPVNYQLYNRQWFYFHRSRHYRHGAALGVGGENGTCATIETLNTFGYPNNPDPRFDLNFYHGYVIENNDTVFLDDGSTPLYYASLEANRLDLSGSEYEKTAGARIKKYEFDKNAITDGTIGNNDIVLFRFADVLLMKAEALARQGIDATNIVNQIRKRVNAADLTSVTLEDIYQERWRELMWEGWHRNDMIRFRHFTDETTSNIINTGETFNYTTVFPIPQDILDMNTEWKQNKGYPTSNF